MGAAAVIASGLFTGAGVWALSGDALTGASGNERYWHWLASSIAPL